MPSYRTMVSNRNQINNQMVPNEATKLEGMFPGSRGPIVTIAGEG